MASITLNWNGRAPQAPSIPDSEWEKHKALICELRPTMTLDRLIEVMAERVGFKASRHQYKLRFQKWRLPRVEAFAALQESSSQSSTSHNHTSAHEDRVEISSDETATQNLSEGGMLQKVLSQLSAYIKVDRSFHVSLDRSGSNSYRQESLHGSPAPSFSASDPDLVADSVSNFTLDIAPVSQEDMLTKTTAEPLATDTTGFERLTPIFDRNQVLRKDHSRRVEKLLRPLFEWCATMLWQPYLALAGDVVERLGVAVMEKWDYLTVRRALSSLFRGHFWTICNKGSKTCVLQWAEEISDKMQIRCFDLFETIALALMGLADLESLLHQDKPIVVDGLYSSFWELVDQVHDAALALVSGGTKLSDFIFPISNVRLRNLPGTRTALPRREPYNFSKHLRPVSNDPPFNPSPRSSISSGLRSILSLRQRIASRKALEGISGDNFSDRMSISCRASWSLRHQLGLSGTSMDTFSIMDTESARSIAMDWEPAVSGIQQGVAVRNFA